MLPVTPVSTRHDRLKPASLLGFSRREGQNQQLQSTVTFF